MSIMNSLYNAVSGMNAQSDALGRISDNVANSQTAGFKRVDSRFEDMVAMAGGRQVAGGVISGGAATNDVQGSIAQVDNPLSLALNGRGFFSVARPVTRDAEGVPTFDAKQMFSRAGDFSLDRAGYLVNGSGDVLQGWTTDAAGTADRTSLSPIAIDRSPLAAEPTGRIALSANLPSTAAAGTTATTQAQAYDALGALQDLDLTWTKGAAANSWTLNVTMPAAGGGAPTNLGSYTLLFGANGAPAGTVGEIQDNTGAVLASYAAATSTPATLTFAAGAPGATQDITLDLGLLGGTAGVTQFAGAAYDLRSLTRDGAAAASFSGVAVREDGRVVATYDDGRSRTIAQVPVVTFADANALERMDGQAFGLTQEAGSMRVSAAGENGAAQLETAAVEGSNVDIAAEFSRMIIAQRAYTANSRVVTTGDEMLQDVINLKR
jgi:flagellar hook protein FlgE